MAKRPPTTPPMRRAWWKRLHDGAHLAALGPCRRLARWKRPAARPVRPVVLRAPHRVPRGRGARGRGARRAVGHVRRIRFRAGNPRRPERVRVDGRPIRPLPPFLRQVGHHPSRSGFDDPGLHRLKLHGGGAGLYSCGARLAHGGGGRTRSPHRAGHRVAFSQHTGGGLGIHLAVLVQAERVHRVLRPVPHQLRVPDALFPGKHRRDGLRAGRGAAGGGRDVRPDRGAGCHPDEHNLGGQLGALHD